MEIFNIYNKRHREILREEIKRARIIISKYLKTKNKKKSHK